MSGEGGAHNLDLRTMSSSIVGEPFAGTRRDNSSTEKIQLHTTKKSRESSPIRKEGNPSASTMPTPTKTNSTYRKKSARSTFSSRETSPIRTSLAAAGKSSLSQNSNASAQQTSEGPTSPRTQRPLSNAPHLRLGTNKTQSIPSRSPALSPRKNNSEQTTLNALPPSVVQLRSDTTGNGQGDDSEDYNSLPSGMRTPRTNSSQALETVMESSLPSTPALGTSRILAEKVAAAQARPDKIAESERAEVSSVSTVPRSAAESESESGYRSEDRPWHNPSSQKTPAAGPARVFSRRPTLTNMSQQNNETSSRNMTVETETVTSMLQLGGGPGNAGASIRSKKSSDTIRAPRKEKKRTVKKASTNSSGNPPSSKADIFAAKVAEAVNEANSSDSDETFVYESNPPEPSQRPNRYHSRTPSATSIHDPRVRNLPLHDLGPPGSRSKMKFQPYNGSNATVYDGGDGSYGTGIGGNSRNGSYGVISQNGGNSGNIPRAAQYPNLQNRSIMADESPFIAGGRKPSHQSLRQTAMAHISSKNASPIPRSSPRNSTGTNGNGHGAVNGSKKSRLGGRYGIDEEAADDERVPLISSQNRVNRDRRRRPGSASLRQLEHNQFRRRTLVGRYAGCIIAIVGMLLIVSGIAGFMFATSKALQDVRILNITDVLVSRQEIMLDLIVQAINPNVVGVTVQTMDVNLFAKSSYVRDDKDKDKDGDGDGDEKGEDDDLWLNKIAGGMEDVEDTLAPAEQFLLLEKIDQKSSKNERTLSSFTSIHHSKNRKLQHISTLKKGVDEGTDPDPDQDQEDRQTMLLGRIFQFDSALNFDGSPFQHRPSVSMGGLRLAKPGNKTEQGGTERWERVILHPFELIVRGVFKYQLPLSGRIRTASIGGSVMVNPADDPTDVPPPKELVMKG